MKSLTVGQPYASLIASGEKRVENRTWPTTYRGPLYIHAGKSLEWLCLRRGEKPPACMVFGAVVAITRLVDCLRYGRIQSGQYDRQYPWLREHAHASGPWCWVLDQTVPIGPWPYRGAQGLFEINDEELDAIATREIARLVTA